MPMISQKLKLLVKKDAVSRTSSTEISRIRLNIQGTMGKNFFVPQCCEIIFHLHSPVLNFMFLLIHLLKEELQGISKVCNGEQQKVDISI